MTLDAPQPEVGLVAHLLVCTALGVGLIAAATVLMFALSAGAFFLLKTRDWL